MSGRWRVTKMRVGAGWLTTCPADRHGRRYGDVAGCYCDWHYTWWGAMSWATRNAARMARAER